MPIELIVGLLILICTHYFAFIIGEDAADARWIKRMRKSWISRDYMEELKRQSEMAEKGLLITTQTDNTKGSLGTSATIGRSESLGTTATIGGNGAGGRWGQTLVVRTKTPRARKVAIKKKK